MTIAPAPAPAPGSARLRGRQGGPPLIVMAASFTVLTIASLILGVASPRPDASAVDTTSYALDHHTRLVWLALVVFSSAIPLAIWAATAYVRLQRLGVKAPGAVMALSGGLLASASLALSGLSTWVLADVADRAEPAVARMVSLLSFGTGGPGFVVWCALMLAGVCVPALILRLTARPLAWAGMVLAALGMLATFTLLTSTLYPLLPAVRFGGLIWLLAVSVLLPANRPGRLRERNGAEAPASV